jgi:hypothetical protein
MARRQLRVIIPAPRPCTGLAEALGRRVERWLVLGYPAQREFRIRPQGSSQDIGTKRSRGGSDRCFANYLAWFFAR